MITGRIFGPVLALVLCIVGLAAAWFVYRALQTPTDPAPSAIVTKEKPANAKALPAVEVFKLPPFRSFEATLERPVFSRNRRPKADAPVVLSQELALKMQGVSGTDGDRRALLIPMDGGERLRLREGEEYQGWTLSEIGDHHVVFLRGDTKQRLEMNFKEPPKPVRGRPARPGARQPGNQDLKQRAVQKMRNELRQQRQQQRRLQQQRQQQQDQQQENLQQGNEVQQNQME